MTASAYKYGETNPCMLPAATAQAIAKGDLVGMVSNTLVRAEDITWDTNIATTQEAFHDVFAGVAGQRKRATTDVARDLRVAQTGVWEFDCASATFAKGSLVGAAKQSGNALESQKVVAVATANLAVGRVHKEYTSAVTRVLVRIEATLFNGGPKAMA